MQDGQPVDFAYLPNLTWDYYQGMDMPKYVKSIEKVDDLTVKFVLTEPNAPMIANLGMDFASIVSKEYADKLAAAGTPELFSTQAGRHRPVPVRRLPARRGHPLRGLPRLLGRQGQDRRPDLRHHDGASVRAQKLKAGECDIMPYPAPADIAGLQADPNLTVMEQEGLNIGYHVLQHHRARRSTTSKVRKALNMAINKQAIIEAVYQGAGQAGQQPDPADDVVVQQRGRRRRLRSGRRQEDAGGSRRHRL